MTKFEKEVAKSIELFKILKKSLDFETEIIVLNSTQASLYHFYSHKKRWNQIVKIKLVRTYKGGFFDKRTELKHSIFAIYIKEHVKEEIIKTFDLKCKDFPMHEQIKKLYNLLYEAQQSN